jgi:dTDP-4-dehydrorhamnose 3,5-epimerase
MIVESLQIPAVKLIKPKVFSDARGFFLESWNEKVFSEIGINTKFVQDNHSRSQKNTLRGLHYQIMNPQGKLVRCTKGEVLDVAVDLRRKSKTFGLHVTAILSEENKNMLWVPPGFAHGFLVTSDIAEFQYKCTDYYAPEFERTLLWSDPALGIDWPKVDGEIIISEKDEAGSFLADCEVY